MSAGLSPIRRVASSAALFVAGAAVLLGAAELVARACVPRPLPMLGRYPLVGVAWRPGYRTDRLSLDTPPQRFTFEVNPLGFRGESMRTEAKPPGTYRIFFLGASTTENAFFPEDRTYPGRIEAALAKKLGGKPRIEVANCGVAGATTEAMIDTLVHRVLHLEPDLVFVLEGHNELCLTLDPAWDPRALGEPEPPPTFKDWLVGSSRLVATLDDWAAHRHSAVDKHNWYRKRALERHSKPISSPAPFDVTRGVPDFASSLHRLVLLCKDAGVPCVVLTQPSLYKDKLTPEEEAALITGSGAVVNLDTPTLLRGLDAYNGAIRRVAREDGCGLVDLARVVPSDLAHFMDDVHFTSEGNAAVAEAILQTVFSGATLPARTK